MQAVLEWRGVTVVWAVLRVGMLVAAADLVHWAAERGAGTALGGVGVAEAAMASVRTAERAVQRVLVVV